MRRARIDLQHLLHVLPGQRRLGEHAPHRPLDDAVSVLREQRLERGEPLVPHVASVPEVALLLELPPCELHLLRVHDDHEVTGVQVGRERGLVLAPQDLCDATREPSERLPGGVHDVPATRDVLFPERKRLHAPLAKKTWRCDSREEYQRRKALSTRSFRAREGYERRPLFDRLADRHVHGCHHSTLGSPQLVLHLHRLHHHESRPALHPLTRRDLRSEEHTSELQSLAYLVCRLLLEKKKNKCTSDH